jgi:hypothetical protein
MSLSQDDLPAIVAQLVATREAIEKEPRDDGAVDKAIRKLLELVGKVFAGYPHHEIDPGVPLAVEEKLLEVCRWTGEPFTLSDAAGSRRREWVRLINDAVGILDEPPRLPWAEEDYGELQPLPRFLLQYMERRKSAALDEVCWRIWGKSPELVSDNSISRALSAINKFVGRFEPWKKRLRKVGDDEGRQFRLVWR